MIGCFTRNQMRYLPTGNSLNPKIDHGSGGGATPARASPASHWPKSSPEARPPYHILTSYSVHTYLHYVVCISKRPNGKVGIHRPHKPVLSAWEANVKLPSCRIRNGGSPFLSVIIWRYDYRLRNRARNVSLLYSPPDKCIFRRDKRTR